MALARGLFQAIRTVEGHASYHRVGYEILSFLLSMGANMISYALKVHTYVLFFYYIFRALRVVVTGCWIV